MIDTVEIMAEEFKMGYPLTYDAIYNKGRADQKEEDNAFFNFEGAWELEKKKVRADAIDECRKILLNACDCERDRVVEDETDCVNCMEKRMEQLKNKNKANIKEVIDMEGYVVESDVCYKRITYVKPVKRDYSDKDHPNYYKYTCPVCDMLNNKHQVNIGDTNCALCNVNLIWE